MPRSPLTIRPIKLTIHLPEDVALRLQKHLKKQGKIPKGAYQAFFVARIQDFLGEEK